MQIYLFKDSKGAIHALNEVGAHNELRNKNTLQRQDLVYLGMCDDNSLKDIVKNKRNDILKDIIEEHEQIQLINQEKELAELKKDTETLKIKQAEKNILVSTISMQVKKPELIDAAGNYYIDENIDAIKTKLLTRENEIFQEALLALEPNPNILPRNFNKVTSSFMGDDPIISDALSELL